MAVKSWSAYSSQTEVIRLSMSGNVWSCAKNRSITLAGLVFSLIGEVKHCWAAAKDHLEAQIPPVSLRYKTS